MPIAQGSALGELIERIYPGASEEQLKDFLRMGADIVVLTQAQYDAITPKNPTTIYVVAG